jgi:hypothetical protein
MSFDDMGKITLKYWGKKIVRSILRSSPLIQLIRIKARKGKIVDIQAVLTAEINTFRRLTKDQKIHIAIKILKVTNQW